LNEPVAENLRIETIQSHSIGLETNRFVSMNPHIKIRLPNWEIPSQSQGIKPVENYLLWIYWPISVKFIITNFNSLFILSSTRASGPTLFNHQFSR
jgi:hypothetical protein